MINYLSFTYQIILYTNDDLPITFYQLPTTVLVYSDFIDFIINYNIIVGTKNFKRKRFIIMIIY